MGNVRRWIPRALTLAAAIATVAVTVAAGAPGAQTATPGVVIVNTRLAYGGGGAGTGIVLTPSGDVLTNNHVIRGAGSIRVTVPAAGRTYTATVTGYSVSKDVALLSLQGAEGLATARTGNSNGVEIGDRVTTVGNAGGEGLSTKTGKVTGLRQNVTVSDDGVPFTLAGLIETTAPLEPGDSGGPMLVDGRVIGVDAVASSNFYYRDTGQGYAIPINRALTIAAQIQTGRSSSTVHVGPTAFLGVSLARVGPYGETIDGALVDGVASGSPADRAGLGQNDVIVGFGGKRVSSSTGLKKLVLQSRPGRTVRVTWIDRTDGRTSATVRLAAGPPQ